MAGPRRWPPGQGARGVTPAVKTDVEELSPTRVRLTIEVPFEELKPNVDQA
jgi:FKBP-type peptidyl-prolyl cis-trans isomerase (trigger factor)